MIYPNIGRICHTGIKIQIILKLIVVIATLAPACPDIHVLTVKQRYGDVLNPGGKCDKVGLRVFDVYRLE